MLKLKFSKVHSVKTFLFSFFSLSAAGGLYLLFSLSILISCNTTEPDDIKPGRRDYTWTVDTLFLPFNPFTDITGTSPSDLWVCGPGDADKIFYHYNGNSWTTDNVSRVFSPKSVYSLSNNNVWSSGREGRIWNCSNNIWSEIIQYSFNGITDITFETIYCISNNHIIAGGQYFTNGDYYAIILIYDGEKWRNVVLPEIRTAFADIKINNIGRVFLWGVSFESVGPSRYQFYELSGENLKEIYSGYQGSRSENGSLLQLGSETYFIIGFDFFSYNGSFQKIGRLTDSSKFRNLGIGRNRKDIFLFMIDGIMHYNGEDAIYLYQTIDKSFVSKGIVFEKEVFFFGRDTNGNNLIFHGKLNE